MSLLIFWNVFGTHADVRLASETESAPKGARRLHPGERYYGVPYEDWAIHAGTTVDVLALQARHAVAEERGDRIVAIAPQIPGHDWRSERVAPVALPKEASHGFWSGNRLVGCSPDALIKQCVEAPETPGVWTPDTNGVVAPESVPFLVEALRSHRRSAAERGIGNALLAVVVSVYFTVALTGGLHPGLMILIGIAAAWSASSLYAYRTSVRLGPEGFVRAREESRHSVWITSSDPVYTRFLLLGLAAVALAQSFGMTAAIQAAGLLKPEVREGEVWRLLTGTLLHGGLLHLSLNGAALWSLGPVLEAYAGRRFLPLVFLVAALVGSLFSLYLLPETRSVGASGGILGLVGYLLVVGYRERRALPVGFVQRMAAAVLATAVFGLFGYALVDNAMHLGGLIGGTLLALLFPRGSFERSAGTSRRVDGLGLLATGTLAAAWVWALTRIYLGLRGL